MMIIKKNTCYNFNQGNDLTYSEYKHYQDKKYNIISFEDTLNIYEYQYILFMNKTKSFSCKTFTSDDLNVTEYLSTESFNQIVKDDNGKNIFIRIEESKRNTLTSN